MEDDDPESAARRSASIAPDLDKAFVVEYPRRTLPKRDASKDRLFRCPIHPLAQGIRYEDNKLLRNGSKMGKSNIIALLSQKGGSGKTTLTMQLVAGLALRGFRVSVGDLDPQESASRWIESSEANAAVGLARLAGDAAEIHRAIVSLERSSDFVVLDCPPSIEHPHTAAALDVCDLALVPVVPSPTDLWSTRAIERLIVNRMEDRPALRGALVPNRVMRTVLAGDVLDVMREFSLPVLGAMLSQRNAYAECAIRGGSVYDLGKTAAAAQGEVDRLVTAVLDQLGR